MDRGSGGSSDIATSQTFEPRGPTSQALTAPSAKQPNIFSRLTTSQRNRVIARGVHLQLSEGETLFAQGEKHAGVYLIEDGLVRTFYGSPAGREMTLAYWQPGNIVGDRKS